MKLQATHTTRYLYSKVVSTCHSEAHLRPRPCPGQTVLDHHLSIDPAPDFSASRTDYFGNPVTTFSISQPHRELTITSRCAVDLTPSGTPGLQLSPPWEEVREQARRRALPDNFEASQFVFESPLVTLGEPFASYAAPSFEAGRPILDAANDLSRRIFEEFKYDKRATTISTPTDEVLQIPPRRVPGFRAPDDRLPALAGAARALRQRVSAQRREPHRRGSLPRVGFGLVPGARLAGLRPH